MKRIRLRWMMQSVLVFLMAVSWGSAIYAADWNQWRGPHRSGTMEGFQEPAQWPEQLVRKWKVEVGIGHSSPLAVGDSVYVFARQGENEVVKSLDLATGREMWKQSYPAPYEMNPAAQAHGKGPKSTPVCSEGRLYTFGISGILSCFDAQTGKPLWRHDFSGQFSKTSPIYGTAMSPVVDNGLLIAHVGGHDDGALIAFDTKTGEVRWRWDGDGPAYASPIIVTLSGVRQVVTQTQRKCVGISARDGKLLWEIPFTTPYDQNCVTPAAAGDLLIFSGLQKRTFAVRPARSGDGWTPEEVWETRDATLYLSSPVVSGSRIYGLSERRSGQMFALDIATGKTLWTGEARFAENAAVYDGGSVLLALTTDAALHVFKKNGDSLQEVARYEVADSPTWASPAISGNRILIKDENTLALWEIPG